MNSSDPSTQVWAQYYLQIELFLTTPFTLPDDLQCLSTILSYTAIKSPLKLRESFYKIKHVPSLKCLQQRTFHEEALGYTCPLDEYTYITTFSLRRVCDTNYRRTAAAPQVPRAKANNSVEANSISDVDRINDVGVDPRGARKAPSLEVMGALVLSADMVESYFYWQEVKTICPVAVLLAAPCYKTLGRSI